jgi:hypothetical protein
VLKSVQGIVMNKILNWPLGRQPVGNMIDTMVQIERYRLLKIFWRYCVTSHYDVVRPRPLKSMRRKPELNSKLSTSHA